MGIGHDMAIRTFLDEYLKGEDAFVDLSPGLGTAVLSAATAPRPPRTIVIVEPDDAEAERVARLVARRAPLVSVVRADDARSAMRRIDFADHGRLVVRVGEGIDVARTVDAVGSTEAPRRPAIIAWSRLVPADVTGPLTFLESLGYVTVALTVVRGESALDAIEDSSVAQTLVSIAHAALDEMEAEAEASPPVAAVEPRTAPVGADPGVDHHARRAYRPAGDRRPRDRQRRPVRDRPDRRCVERSGDEHSFAGRFCNGRRGDDHG